MAVDDILRQVPVDDIAAKLGVSADVAEQAVQQGGAVLLGGLAKNVESAEGSAAIEKALRKHGGKPASRASTRSIRPTARRSSGTCSARRRRRWRRS